MGRLEGKVAIITGSGRGIGRGIALACAREGARVVVVDWVAPAVEDAVHEISQVHKRVLGVVCDVGDEDEVKRMVGRAVEKFGRVDLLVNAAGWNVANRSLEKLSVEDYRLIMGVNLDGAFYVAQSFLPVMRRQRSGTMIFIGSIAGIKASVLAGPDRGQGQPGDCART